MSFQRSYEGPWNRRLYDLAGAVGWTLMELSLHLGFKSRLPLNRILQGGRPKVSILLTLQRLESAYAAEIKEFIKQGRPFKKFQKQRRAKLRYARIWPETVGTTDRPSDIAQVGVVETLGQNGWDGLEGSPIRPSKVVVWSDPRRYKRKKDRAVESGRSPAESGRQEESAECDSKGAVS